MEMLQVNSSNIVAIGYDPNSAVLCIEFKDRSAYEYFDVPQYDYDGLMLASSHGTYANQNIYKKYRQNKIR